MAGTTPITATVEQITAAAMTAGLAPHTYLRSPRSVREVTLNSRTTDGAFGTVVIGARTGRVLRADLTYGNTGPTVHFRGGRAVLRALRVLAAQHTG